MTDIQSVGISGADRYRQVAQQDALSRQAPPPPAPPGRESDRVEISELARELAQREPAFRSDLVARVRAEIESGAYETPESLEGAIDGLLNDLRLEA